jgi:uncharacterized protein (TIGR00730 family)
MRSLNICVFCGSRTGTSPEAIRLATEVGELIGRRGHQLVYGGGGIGLMGAVAFSAARAGAFITGVMPKFLFEREQEDAAPDQTLVVTTDMFDRKREMIRRADVFLALPGGYGTLDEVIEVVSLAYLDACSKPVVLLDVDGGWEPLHSLFTEFKQRGFIGDTRPLYYLANTPDEALRQIELLATEPSVDDVMVPALSAGSTVSC